VSWLLIAELSLIASASVVAIVRFIL
jgi:hypothetical protein